jgi:prepilin-type N-terminal cleavage/methylation domain-containing protein
MRRHRGYTLIEMLMVLAVLVLLAAVSAPALRGIMRRANLTAAGDAVRSEITRAHVRAMKSGRTQVVTYELGGRRYRVQPWIAGDDALEGSGQSAGASEGMGSISATDGGDDKGHERQLPEGTTFAGGDALEESRASVVADAVAGGSSMDGEWSRPILFYPDGSSSDAFVVVADEFQHGLQITLIGLTGAAKVGRVTPLDKLLK